MAMAMVVVIVSMIKVWFGSFEDLEGTGGPVNASGSANEGGYAHDHGYGSLPTLAEHKMKPLYALEINCDCGKSNRAVKPVQDPPLLSPHMLPGHRLFAISLLSAYRLRLE
ncbi:hypothetical protein DL95DRAFT_467367 [Leptodontidium sp. 2 PMI_412]|nr:hypothetical protein DL95DRAFT_467367 [Leptodontidium sp. 2 PMI_412]